MVSYSAHSFGTFWRIYIMLISRTIDYIRDDTERHKAKIIQNKKTCYILTTIPQYRQQYKRNNTKYR